MENTHHPALVGFGVHWLHTIDTSLPGRFKDEGLLSQSACGLVPRKPPESGKIALRRTGSLRRGGISGTGSLFRFTCPCLMVSLESSDGRDAEPFSCF